MTKDEIIELRKQNIGRRIRLVDIVDKEKDPQMAALIGTCGTIMGVGSLGEYHVKWDEGSSLDALIEDTVEFVDEDEDYDEYAEEWGEIPTDPEDPRYGEYMAELSDRHWDERYDRALDTMESKKAQRKSRKNTMYESAYTDEDIEFTARYIGGCLAGYHKGVPKEVYNDFLELVNDDNSRDIIMEQVSMFYNQMTSESMSESKKRRKNLNESFDDQELTDMVKDHGGLISLRGKYNYSGTRDARQNQVGYDLKRAKPKGYISEDVLVTLQNENVDFYIPLEEQLLFCNDGGAIIIEDPRDSYTIGKDNPYEAKVRERNNKFRKAHGEENYHYCGVDNYSSRYRREQHFGRLKPDQNLYFKN